MSSIAEIRHRARVVGETRKITKAMYLISSVKMKKAVRMHDFHTQYFRRVRSDMRFILENTPHITHAYFNMRMGRRAAYLVIAGDKGLCGAYNANVMNAAWRHMHEKEREGRYVFCIGQVTREFFERRGVTPDVEYLNVSQNPDLSIARAITLELCDLFEKNMLDEVYVAFTEMESIAVQTPRILRLLPILHGDFENAEILHQRTAALNYHPSARGVFDALVPQYLIGLVYNALVQSYGSEQCARMNAMDNSTRNADDMIRQLSLDLSRARQNAITQEITEIVAGAEALQ